MRTNFNKFGVPRTIPESVKRKVRQECGFACVVCGKIGMHYDHFDPEFTECKEHAAPGIALLCPTCHQDKTSNRIDNNKIRMARIRSKNKWNNPAWKSNYSGRYVGK